MEHCFPPQWNTWRELVSKQKLSCAHLWLCNNNSELATLHCEKTGSGTIRQIFIISRGPILVKCPSVFDSLSAGSAASGDNSNMNTRFNQLSISLLIKVWDVLTTVKTYLHFILFFGKWMSLEILRYKRILTPYATGHPARCWCPLVERHQLVHQQPASWLLFKNVKWPVVHYVFATLQLLNKRRQVNHDLLIYIYHISLYIRLTRGF